MLVISFKRETDGTLHVLRRVEERALPDIEKWFFSVLAEINYYLPEGWRMTKRTNNFRIQIINPNPVLCLALVGSSYKKDAGNGIISIIDTVLPKGSFDSVEAKNIKSLKEKRPTKQDKKNNPELLQPNLYFFQPCPEDSHSPLFARQYERIKKIDKNQKVGVQYHRIHPLTKAGLDLEHYKWIKWDTCGNIQFVDYPEEDYHGKDFWKVPYLKDDNMRSNEEEYLRHYKNNTAKYKIADLELKDPFPAPYERELKYTYEGTLKGFRNLLNTIKEWLDEEGFIAIWGSSKDQIDLYFDDQDFTLFKSGVSFRLRKKKDNARITIKKKHPVKENGKPANLYVRMEEEVVISKSQEKALLNGERIIPFPYRLIAYLAPGHSKLETVMEVKNKRVVGIVTAKGLHKIEICHDIVNYEIQGNNFGPFFEIELESKGADDDLTSALAELLQDKLKLRPSLETKYERGVSLISKQKIS